MTYFSERNGLRNPIKKTYQITIPMYSLIFDCCTRFFDNLAWKYSLDCPDGYGCCGIDLDKLSNDLIFEIPELYRRSDGTITSPQDSWDKFDQYALLDFVEFIATNIKDISKRDFHSYFMHEHLHFRDSREIAREFIKEINGIFSKTDLLYKLNENFEIERIVENEILTEKIEETIDSSKEIGIKELLQEAVALHKSPLPNDNKNVEKIWDAFERLKTYFTDLDKKNSANKIIKIVSNENQQLESVLSEEFIKLTTIGNQYRIRHHETDKIELTDIRHNDYFFNRCLSLISLALQYLS